MKQFALRVFKIIGRVSDTFIVVMLVGFVAVNLFLFDDDFDNRLFDRQLWLAHDNSLIPDNPRGEMYDDIVGNRLAIGDSKPAVMALLGVPDYRNEPQLLSYNLGMWSGLKLDYDTLDLVFDTNGQLTHYYRVQH